METRWRLGDGIAAAVSVALAVAVFFGLRRIGVVADLAAVICVLVAEPPLVWYLSRLRVRTRSDAGLTSISGRVGVPVREICAVGSVVFVVGFVLDSDPVSLGGIAIGFVALVVHGGLERYGPMRHPQPDFGIPAVLGLPFDGGHHAHSGLRILRVRELAELTAAEQELIRELASSDSGWASGHLVAYELADAADTSHIWVAPARSGNVVGATVTPLGWRSTRQAVSASSASPLPLSITIHAAQQIMPI